MSGRKHERMNAFEQDRGDLAAVADEIYGANRGPVLDTGRMVATPTDIWSISSDPRQPRRALPSAVRSQKLGAHASLLHWMYLAYCETTGTPVNVETHQRLIASDQVEDMYRQISAGDAVQTPEKPGPLEAGLLALVGLAANIRQDGLVNPITVAQVDRGSYVIETGERRWLAHHLLAYFGHVGFDKIPARVVEFDVWRQAAENNQRSDLNAIGRARQFAILLMDLLAQAGADFQPFELFEREQDFYAQVADEKQYRIPGGKTDQILNALGIKSRQTLSDYRRLLSLPNEVWIQGDDENWTVNDLLKIVRSSDNFGINAPIQTEETPVFGINPTPLPPPHTIGRGQETAVGQGDNIPNADAPISQTDHGSAAESEVDPFESGPQFGPGDRVNTRGLHLGTVISQRGLIVSVRTDNDGVMRSHHAVDLTLVKRAEPALTPQPPLPHPTGTLRSGEGEQGTPEIPASVGRWPKVGDLVVTQNGQTGTVTQIISGNLVQVKTAFRRGVFGVDELEPYVAHPDSPAAADRTSEGIDLTPGRSADDPARFVLPFSAEPATSTNGETGRLIMDARRRMVGRWTPSPLEPRESAAWAEWLVYLGNATYFADQVPLLLRVIEYMNGSPADDYHPADALDDIAALLSYLQDAAATVAQDMDRAEES